ncbi:MAG: HEPN domain-containing protein [Nitrospinota bacterium]|nr:HEPN domain-containing protein [Nitrospinota bacterium]
MEKRQENAYNKESLADIINNMLRMDDLLRLSRARLDDAKALQSGSRNHGGIYLSGYAVELALKARICIALSWDGYPSNSKEFRNYQSFKTHDFDVLLHLSGLELEVKTNPEVSVHWSILAEWNPEARYEPLDSVTEENAKNMIMAVEKMVEHIWKKS